MEEFGKRLERLRIAAGLNNRELAIKCGWADSTSPGARISNYKSASRHPKPADAEKIAKALNVTLYELIRDTDYRYSSGITGPQETSINKIPMVDWDLIPNATYDLSKFMKDSDRYIDLSFTEEPNVFASEVPSEIVPGESDAYFKSGEVLLISPTRKPKSKQHVVAYKKGWTHPFYMFYMEVGDEIKLRHTSYFTQESMLLTDDIQICGVVVASYKIFI